MLNERQEIRVLALDRALEYIGNSKIEVVLEMAEQFEKYISNGVYRSEKDVKYDEKT